MSNKHGQTITKSCFSEMTGISQIASKKTKLPERSKTMAKKTHTPETAYSRVGNAGLVVYYDNKHCKASFDVQSYESCCDLTYGDIRRILQRAYESTLDKADDDLWDSAFLSKKHRVKITDQKVQLGDETEAHRTEEDEQDD